MAENDTLILVDRHDKEIGHESKQNVHDGKGLLHRAFSILIVNSRGEMLLQQRAATKRLWPLYWANACCSHPRKGEDINDAIHRRLQEELGFDCKLDYLYQFEYHASFKDEGSEHELCYVFLGKYDDKIVPNKEEVNQLRFIALDALEQDLKENPGKYAPWFILEIQELFKHYRNQLGEKVQA
ncbi:isopentenyl-diphosphate Delta-isomerase [Candidatus Woesearchaeota archaeon]|nr:isopentenyl-diphosphate Delta-isomerase [Candidatus Woesearchaeota archaeon]